MHSDTSDALELRFTGNGSRRSVSVLVGGQGVYCDEFNIRKVKDRHQFITDLSEKVPSSACLKDQIEARLIEDATKHDQGTGEVPASPASVPDFAELLATMPQEIREMALDKLRDPLLIKHVVDDIAALGVAGEREMSAHIYLTGTSRLLDKPQSLIVQGPSSS